MGKWPHLDRAPITEALVDIRAELPDTVDLEALKQFSDHLGGRFPKQRARTRWHGEIRVPQQGSVAQQVESRIDGFMYTSSDDHDVLQARLDGFTTSRVGAYHEWKSLRTLARDGWSLYCKTVRPKGVTRIAVRFLNRICLRRPVNLAEWFVIGPSLPSLLAEQSPSFFMKVAVGLKGGARAIVNFMIEEQALDDTDAALVLDIDVFKEARIDPNSESIWADLDALRDQKNDIFFQCLTTRMLQKLEPRWQEGADSQ